MKLQASEDPNELLLVPSQVGILHKSSSEELDLMNDRSFADGMIVPSQVPIDNTNQKKNKHKKKNNRKKLKNGGRKKQPTIETRKFGDFPDIEWRAVPMKDLRLHPNFDALPQTIKDLKSLDDVKYFRQESWQWDRLHEGRCTTSIAVAALGFLEPKAGIILGVPRSWQHGASGAYHRLRQPALRTLNEMNDVLFSQSKEEDDDNDEFNINSTQDTSSSANDVWRRLPNFPFSAKYMVPVNDSDRQQRKEAINIKKSPIRMQWGNAQEATALLTGLNYFCCQQQQESDDRIRLQEIGMCGASLQLTMPDNSSNSTLLLGATPDALICHADGTKEVLEVKNHCPFFPSTGRSKSRFARRNCHFGDKPSVMPQYVPQLMMEMLCSDCQSAVMIRQSATSGAIILRIARDDEWIEEMLHFLTKFQSDYVDAGIPPPQNFFLDSDDTATALRYKQFLDRTQGILKNKVTVLAHVPHSKIQRATASTPGTITDLFL